MRSSAASSDSAMPTSPSPPSQFSIFFFFSPRFSLFFVAFVALLKDDPENVVLIWLQGGPPRILRVNGGVGRAQTRNWPIEDAGCNIRGRYIVCFAGQQYGCLLLGKLEDNMPIRTL